LSFEQNFLNLDPLIFLEISYSTNQSGSQFNYVLFYHYCNIQTRLENPLCKIGLRAMVDLAKKWSSFLLNFSVIQLYFWKYQFESRSDTGELLKTSKYFIDTSKQKSRKNFGFSVSGIWFCFWFGIKI
jgi:hypothetical protein